MARSYMEELIYIIGHNESGNKYDSINKTEVISIGLFNWYAARALGLARSIVTLDPGGSRTALSAAETPLYSQITSGNNSVWNSYIPGHNQNDMNALKAFLSLPASKTAQDALAQTDGANYSSQAKAVGIVVPAAQIYYADLYNQSPKQAQNIIRSIGNGAAATLESLHNAAMANSVMSKYATRRNWTYNELKQWASEVGGGETDVPVTPPVNPPTGDGSGEGNIPDGYTGKDYFYVQNGCAIKYSSDYPNGILYVEYRKGVFFPYNPLPELKPVIVDSVSDMTEHDKIYVLSSNKHIYVWDGVKFIDTNAVWKGDV